MSPILTKTRQVRGDRIGITWRLFGVPVYGMTFMPWDTPKWTPFHWPHEFERARRPVGGQAMRSHRHAIRLMWITAVVVLTLASVFWDVITGGKR